MKTSILFTIFFGVLLATSSASSEEDHNFRERIHLTVIDANTITNDTIAEIDFGREVAAKILGNYNLLRNENLTRYVSLVGNKLARNANRPELAWHFAVLDTDTINAYTAPGGYVFITKGALLQMHDEAELAAVLAHEISHVTERHIVKALNVHGTDKSASASMARLVGSINETARTTFNQVVDGAVQILFEKGLNHNDEFQADRDGIMLLANSGYDPMALVRYLTRVQQAKPESTTVLTKTHPAIAQRLNMLNTLVAEEKLDSLNGQIDKARFQNNVKF